MQLRFVPGTITVLMNPTSGSTLSTDCLLRLIYRDYNVHVDGDGMHSSSSSSGGCGGGGGDSSSILLDGGSVVVHGGRIEDWDFTSLRKRIIFLKEEEARLQLQAGTSSCCS